MRSALVGLVALVACGSNKPPPAHEDLDEQAAPKRDAPPTLDAQPNQKGVRQPWSGPPPACPASFAAATGTCPVEQDCAYPEGTCRCEEPGHCSGANLRRPPEPLEWVCTKPTPAVRPDGCPGPEPHGDACKTEGKQCTYGSCCVSTLTCESGHWIQKKPTECPP
jgi:hypothetical protein